MRIRDLNALERLDMQSLRAMLPDEGEGSRRWTPELELCLSQEQIKRFKNEEREKMQGILEHDEVRLGHFIFISHYKQENGTEAALIRSELMTMISEDPSSPAHGFDVPFFLDSEDLFNLHYLTEQVWDRKKNT